MFLLYSPKEPPESGSAFLYPEVYQLRQKRALFLFGLSFGSGEMERTYVDVLSVSLSREHCQVLCVWLLGDWLTFHL